MLLKQGAVWNGFLHCGMGCQIGYFSINNCYTMSMMKVLIIGLGTMGTAIAGNMQKTCSVIGAIDPVETARSTAGKLNIECYRSVEDCGDKWEAKGLVILLAVKPQNAPEMLSALSRKLRPDHSIISIIAGLHSDVLASTLQTERVIRFMPTLAAQIGRSVTGIYVRNQVNSAKADELRGLARDIASSFGTYFFFNKEENIAAITGLSGSGIAFMAAFLDAMILAGIREGLPGQQAQDIAVATMESLCGLLAEGQQESFSSPSELIRAVCSPGGTTIEGMQALHSQGMHSAAMSAVHAARTRADEIESNIKKTYCSDSQ